MGTAPFTVGCVSHRSTKLVHPGRGAPVKNEPVPRDARLIV